MPELSSPSEIRSSLIKYAAFCLNRRPYFEETIRQKLILRSKKLKFNDTLDVITDILRDLKNAGYLDDPYLAQAFARRQLGKLYGPKIITQKLVRMRLNKETIDLALEEADIKKQIVAIKKYSLKFPKLDRYKLVSKLYSRGFSTSVINKLFDVEYQED